jgi:hypothetical protein
MCHDFKYFGQHIEIFIEKSKLHVRGIDIDWLDPDRHALDTNPDPDPSKLCGSDPIRIQ